MAETPGIRFDQRGRLGVVTLDQPRTLNALTHDMLLALSRTLADWREADGIGAVLIKGEGDRAFCSGGDIRVVYDRRLAGAELSELTAFFRDEYRMNWRVGAFEKPLVALLDGIVMGGGVGIAAPGDFRVATERTLFAMPETGIGLFPDVGGSYHLSRLEGALGLYLGLTGARLGPADCAFAGLVTSYTPSERLAALEDALASAELRSDAFGEVGDILTGFADEPGRSGLAERKAEIDRLFQGESVAAIVAGLEAEGSDWADEQLAGLGRKSPTSLEITFEQLRRGAGLDFAGGLAQEFRMVSRCLAGHDFYEGVRALLVDKDKSPRWRPDRLEAVTAEEVATYFEPSTEGDLTFDWSRS